MRRSVIFLLLATLTAVSARAGNITVVLQGSGAGRVVSTETGEIDCPGHCTNSYTFGKDLTLRAIPAVTPSPGSRLAGWGGCDSIAGGNCNKHIDALWGNSVHVYATFNQWWSLNVSYSGSGKIAVNGFGMSCSNGSCRQDFEVPPAGPAKVTLTAGPQAGWSFSGWTGECSGTASCTLTMDRNHNVGATFVQNPTSYGVTLTVGGIGHGSVSSTPAGLNCSSGTCSGQFTAGSNVTLIATPNASDSTFSGWTGDCAAAGSSSQCTVTLNRNLSVGANFTLKTFMLNVLVTGPGSVAVTPPGSMCSSGTCTYSYTAGTTISLTAQPSASATFAGFGGACSGSLCAVTMVNGDKTVSATFTAANPTQYTLLVSKSGTGSGNVSSNPAGINCGSDCSEQFAPNTSVVLTATPAAGSRFSGWSGGGCYGTGACTILMTTSQAVTAAFDTTTGCVPGPTTMCLNNGRFRVELFWKTSDKSGSGQVCEYATKDSGLFWFFAEENWEVMVKVLNACVPPFNRYWVYSAGTTDLGYDLVVTDTLSGQQKRYTNPLGKAAAAITDTDAFNTCP